MTTFYADYEIDEESEEVELEISFNYYAGCPAMPYGDPPQPGDDEELEIYEVKEAGVVIAPDKYGPDFAGWIEQATWNFMEEEASER